MGTIILMPIILMGAYHTQQLSAVRPVRWCCVFYLLFFILIGRKFMSNISVLFLLFSLEIHCSCVSYLLFYLYLYFVGFDWSKNHF
jgi:hypothetical protein